MMDRRWLILTSLVVASFTQSHVMARLPKVDVADKAIWLSMSGLGGISVLWIPDKIQRPSVVSGNRRLESLVDAMSSSSISNLG